MMTIIELFFLLVYYIFTNRRLENNSFILIEKKANEKIIKMDIERSFQLNLEFFKN